MSSTHAKPTTHYRIGTVAKLAGVSTHLLRIWERRYDTLAPTRSAGGSRLYTEGDIARLKLLKRLTDFGHPIGSIAPLSDAELGRMIDTLHTRSLPLESGVAGQVSSAFLNAIARLDISASLHALTQGSLTIPPTEFVTTVVIPILHEVGHRWHTGEFTIAHEHAASSILRTHLGFLTRAYTNTHVNSSVVACTLSGELHELGALAAALFAASAGWKVTYLGPNLPVPDIIKAVALCQATVLLLSLVTVSETTLDDLYEVAQRLPKQVRILAGGAAAPSLDNLPTRIEVITNFSELETKLSLSTERSSRIKQR